MYTALNNIAWFCLFLNFIQMDHAAWIFCISASFIQCCKIHFFCNMILHWINRSQFIYPFHYWCTFELFLHIDVHFELLKKNAAKTILVLSLGAYAHTLMKGIYTGVELLGQKVCVSSYQIVVPIDALTNRMWVFWVSCCFTSLPTPGIVRLEHFCQFVDLK